MNYAPSRNTSDHKTAVIAGATGLVGQELVRLLLEHPAYVRVIALVRRSLEFTHPKLEERLISFDRLEEQLDASLLQDADLFCTLGTTIKQAGSREAFRRVDYDYPLALARAAHRHRSACFVIVTAMGASERSSMFYSRVKGEVERDITALGLPRVVIMRPSLLLGHRHEHRLGERLATALFRPLGALMVGPLAKYKAIEGRDVAQAMIVAACSNGAAHEVYRSDQITALIPKT